MSLLGFIFGTFWASGSGILLLFQVRNFSAIISSHVLLPSLSLFSFWVPIMQMLVHLRLFHKFLRLSSLLFSFFCCSDWWVPLTRLEFSDLSFTSSSLLLKPLYFIFQFRYFSYMWFQYCAFLYFIFVEILTLSILLLNSVRRLMTFILNSIR